MFCFSGVWHLYRRHFIFAGINKPEKSLLIYHFKFSVYTPTNSSKYIKLCHSINIIIMHLYKFSKLVSIVNAPGCTLGN